MAGAAALYLSGRWNGDDVLLPASSFVVVFSIQAACSQVPVRVIVVEPVASSRLDNILVGNETNDQVQTKPTISKDYCNGRTVENDSDIEQCEILREDSSNWNDSEAYSKSIFEDYLFPVKVNSLSFPVIRQNFKHCPSMVKGAVFPAIYCEVDRWCIVGMCAALRYIIQSAFDLNNDVTAKNLLGFRDGCLQSCSEVSCWTKFCEIEMPHVLQRVFSNSNSASTDVCIIFPKELLRYNNHMARPPILHNALKRKQQHIRKTVKDKAERELLLSKKLSELPELDHDFAEGLDMTLADVMLFACFDLIVCKLSFMNFKSQTPLILKWLKLISTNENIVRALPLVSAIKSTIDCIELSEDEEVMVPEVIAESLYKSDPERPKLHCVGSMTLQNDIDRVIECLQEAGVAVQYSQECCDESIGLPWSTYPAAVHPQEGQLPPPRLERKCQQLENIVSLVIKYSSPGDRIVDFCAGGGHVGIILAYCLPQCTVVLVENKVSSLSRAKARVDDLALTNVQFYQCNMAYFRGSFDIGVCLHACGQATDIVLQKCYNENAAFVCSPCCYGSIQPNHSVQYPRSALYQGVLGHLTDYLTLCHAADQTHAPDHPYTAQGQLCMRFIDGDRLAEARELGYTTHLVMMTPVTCSPKNHILIGKRS